MTIVMKTTTGGNEYKSAYMTVLTGIITIGMTMKTVPIAYTSENSTAIIASITGCGAATRINIGNGAMNIRIRNGMMKDTTGTEE